MDLPDDVLTYCGKFALAIVLSGILGLERERKGRAAGLRTHVVVCLGSTLAMIVSDILAAEWNNSDAPIWLDRGRIAAGILTGIGFIGAGTIINVGNIHRGLTTAAMVWFAAVLGIAIGVGYYSLSIIATLFTLSSVLLLERVAGWFPEQIQFALSVRVAGGSQRITDMERFIEKQGYIVMAARLRVSEEKEKRTDMTFDIISRTKRSIQDLIEQIQHEFPGTLRITIER
jgi:putative Mg2+ transporter-C (MgtC) family protein